MTCPERPSPVAPSLAPTAAPPQVRAAGRGRMPRLLPLHLALIPALVALTAAAVSAPPLGALADPTRPPPALQPVAAMPGHPSARAGALPGPARAASAVPAEPLPLLQGVQLPARGAPSALLDGRVLRTGDSVAGRRVLAIDNQGVTLSAADGSGATERLSLLAGEVKQPPGSIQITRNARYTPGAAGLPGAAGTSGATDAEQPAAPRELPLSVAERSKR